VTVSGQGNKKLLDYRSLSDERGADALPEIEDLIAAVEFERNQRSKAEKASCKTLAPFASSIK
jgi:hypothetical protein